MFAHKHLKIAVIAVSLGIVSTSQGSMAIAKKDKTSSTKVTKTSNQKAGQNDGGEAAVRSQIDALTAALGSGDAKRLSSLWTEDGSFTDQDGAETKGRADLEKRFAGVFAADGKVLVEFHPDSVRMLDSNVALSKGTVCRKDKQIGGEPDTRYSMIFQKQNGAWLISSATETPLVAASSADDLQALSWLIGEWSAQGEKGSLHMTADWAPNKSFINCIYQIKKAGDSTPIESKQVIGWDPRTQTPISWHFSSDGGFGYGNWSKNDRQWMVDATGVEHDGTTSTATDVISVADPNNFTWQSVRRTVNGAPFGDSSVVKVQRVK